MLSLEKARTYLDEQTNKETSDEQLLSILNDGYILADLAIDMFLEKKKLE
jgi:hypothetical protein